MKEVSQNMSNGSVTISHCKSHNPIPHRNPAKLQESTPKQMITTPTFYVLYTIYALNGISIYSYFAYNKTFSLE